MQPHSSTNWSVIVALVGAAVVFGVVGYYIGTLKNASVPSGATTQTVVSNVITTTTPAVSPTATATTVTATSTATPDPTAGWKTYTSTSHGFSVKYPSNFTVYDDSRDAPDKIETVTITNPNDRDVEGIEPAFTFSAFTYTSLQATIDTQVARYSSTKDWSKKTLTFAGQPATELTWDQLLVHGRPSGIDKGVYFSKNGVTYVVSGITMDSLGQGLGVFDQMLATFQLTK